MTDPRLDLRVVTTLTSNMQIALTILWAPDSQAPNAVRREGIKVLPGLGDHLRVGWDALTHFTIFSPREADGHRSCSKFIRAA